jgi:hypothetical protein
MLSTRSFPKLPKPGRMDPRQLPMFRRADPHVSADGRTLGKASCQAGPVSDQHVAAAAQRVLAGDDSGQAAQALEGVLLDDYPRDERFDDLLEALALYAPGQGAPYVEAEALRKAVRETLVALAARSSDNN